jgi:hypothetical protein
MVPVWKWANIRPVVSRKGVFFTGQFRGILVFNRMKLSFAPGKGFLVQIRGAGMIFAWTGPLQPVDA